MSSSTLDVYLNAVQAGKLVRNNQGNLSFTYSPEFLRRTTIGISLCLPLRTEPFTGTDAHGKNFSLLYSKHKPQLAPAYDLLSTTVYPDLSEKMAMKIGGKYNPHDVFLRHWQRIVPNTEPAKKNIEKQLRIMAKSILDHALGLKETFRQEGLTSPVIDDVCALIKKRSERIASF